MASAMQLRNRIVCGYNYKQNGEHSITELVLTLVATLLYE